MDCYKFDQKISSGQLLEDSLVLPGFSFLNSRKRIPFIIAGVDEAGRGPLAGPVVAAAVILPAFPRIPRLNDSKKVPEQAREPLYLSIKRTALAMAVAVVEPDVIDAINILAASLQAMREAICQLKIHPDLVVVDGNQKPGSGFPERTLVKGDAKSAAIMAASVVAKVTRDRIMIELHEKFPQYGFNEHKGYGVQAHIEALRRHGPCPVHRQTFEPVRNLSLETADLIL